MKAYAYLASAAAVAVACQSSPAFAEEQNNKQSNLEVIEVSAQRLTTTQDQQDAEMVAEVPDVADWLSSIAGGAINKNGTLTGIAQYRGLYGDRVGVTIDGVPVIGAGPNAMDTPLSYAVGPAVDSMTVYRGVAPVSAGLNTFGGAVKVTHKKAQFNESKQLSATGQVVAGFQSQGDAFFLAPSLNAAKNNMAVFAYVNHQTAGDVSAADDVSIRPTRYDRQQLGFDFGLLALDSEWHVNYQRTNTDESGTPALPMDINYINADRFSISGNTQISNLELNWQWGISDAEHGMDNYNFRPNMNPMMTRYNTAASTSMFGHFSIETELKWGNLNTGFDFLSSEHNSVITSPDNMMFEVVNFNDVIDETKSVYAELQSNLNKGQLSVGLRLKDHTSDAQDVDHHMAMMNNAIGMLKNNFNNAERKQQDLLLDATFSYAKPINEQVIWLASTGIKQRAPSYQQRYLWVPMQSTGGLADGHTYIGNPELKPETNRQINVGIEATADDAQWQVSPQLFYQNIADYIQALPSNNMQANMVATMMTGKNPMQFSNVKAALYGLDMLGHFSVSDHLWLEGNLSVVRGERKDIDDNLYRVNADTLRLSVNYQWKNVQFTVVETLVATQDQVSLINDETPTDGYAITDLMVNFNRGQIGVKFGINNVFDEQYESHLAGRYRPMDPNSGIARGQKIPATGRNVYLAGSISF